MEKKRLSIVVPVYNEEDNLHHFYEAVRQTMAGLDLDWEIIFVDDGSRDKSRAILAKLEREDARVQPMLLARNYGHQLALTCGLDHADGDVVITMDGDMQHPPELIPELLKYWHEGYDVVQTIRDATRDASWLKRTTSAGYYKFLNLISEVPVQPGGSDFLHPRAHRRDGLPAEAAALHGAAALCGQLEVLAAQDVAPRRRRRLHVLDLPVAPRPLFRHGEPLREWLYLPARAL